MFETSFVQWMNHFFANIIFPLLPGILFFWIFFGRKFGWMLLYLLSRFVGVGVIAFSMFNLQFFRFGIGVGEYFFLLGVLFFIFVAKFWYQKVWWRAYISTLKIKNILPDIKQSFRQLSQIEKIFTWIILLFGLWFLLTSFVQTTHFPTYADDSFGNRNHPAHNIYVDGWVKLFGEKDIILWRGRLWYPIYVPIYKATVSHIVWEFNDIYINMRQWLVFFFLLVFVFVMTFAKTKHIFYSLLPVGLIISLPLVFFHAGEGYMELASAAYSLLTIWALWKFIEEWLYEYVALWLLFGFILSYVKNDGFVVYLPGILLAFVFVLFRNKMLLKTIQWFWKSTYIFLFSVFSFLFFFLPFLIIKQYYHLWFNQAAGVESGVGLTSTIHWDIFSVFPWIFFTMDNYNVVLVLIFLIVLLLVSRRKNISKSQKFLISAPFVVFIILLLVFLLTDNYRFALDQTTINRVFTISFILLFSFSWLLFFRKWSD